MRCRPSRPLGRLSNNNIGVEGAKAIAAVLKDSQLSTLGCAATSTLHSPNTRQSPMNTFCSPAHSLSNNPLCGVYKEIGGGRYDADGITVLCDWLKCSAVTSLT